MVKARGTSVEAEDALELVSLHMYTIRSFTCHRDLVYHTKMSADDQAAPFTRGKNRILEVQKVATYSHLRTQANANLCGTSMLLSFPTRSYSFSQRTDKISCYDLNIQNYHSIGVAIEMIACTLVTGS